VNAPTEDQASFERRQAPRYPVAAPCELRTNSSRTRGRCLDISEGGVAIEVDGWSAERFTLHVAFPMGRVSVHCETVSIEPILGKSVVHARFAAMEVGSGALLDAVLTQARGNFEAGLRDFAADPQARNRDRSA